MCLAIPGQIESIFDQDGLKMAKIFFGGVRRSACLEYTPFATVGDYVLVHVGFAISVIDEREAEQALKSLRLEDDIEELKATGEIS